ncbi:MAG TPA: lytic transglycosylase domain-containing protein [Bryobacteraceae bacterium]|nr:lytic transglycosylase domain-containing protein [Bryobacteraceae bacterium]
MRFCLKHKGVVRCAGLALLAAGVVSAANPSTPRIRSVVRADSRGRLVRTVVVNHRVPQPQPEELRQVDAASVPALVEAVAKQYDVDPLLVHSVIETESNYNPYAVSPKGAQGLMQLMPGTARRFGVRNSFDIKQNIEGGVRYLKYLGTLFPDDPKLAIAAYNAGEGAVWKYGNNIPPYRETEQYVQRVNQKYGKARRAAEQKKDSEPIQTASAAKVAPPEEVHAPVQVFVDSEGRLYLRNVNP